MFNSGSKYYTGFDPTFSRFSGLFSVITAVFFVLVIIALTLNGIMLIVLFRLRKRIFEPPVSFYTVVVGLIGFTSLNAIVQAVFVAPQYVVQVPISTVSFEQAFFILDTFTNYGILGFSTIVAGNRLSTFSMGIKCPVYSVKPRLYALFFLVCCTAAAFAAAPTALGCRNGASAVGLVCPNANLAEGINIALGAIYYVVCAGSAFLYTKTYWLINRGHRTAPETIILKQALVIFGIYIISLILSTILPLFSSSSSFLLSFSLNSVSLLLSSVYPGLFLVSCGEMRREIASWIPCRLLKSCWRKDKRVFSAQSVSSGVKDHTQTI